MSEITVRALEWSDEAGGEYIAQSVIGSFHIGRPASYWNLTTPHGVVSSYETLDEAKSAAQSYFESRIRSCLLDKPEMESVEAFAWHTSDVYGWDYISRNEENIRSKADEVGGEVTPLFATPPATPSSASQGSADVTSERVERLINAIEGECDGPPSPVGESREVPVKVVEGDSLGDRADLRRVVERVLDLPSAGLASSCELAATILDALEPALCASPSPVESREARLPNDIIERLLAVGRVEWGTSLYQADEKHVEDFRDTLRITREHFATEADETAIHGVYLEGTGTVLAHTGNSPNSPQHARILVGAWNQLVDMALAAKEQQP